MTQLGHEATAKAGRTNQFDVVANGTLLFSKEQQGRFPELDEILPALG